MLGARGCASCHEPHLLNSFQHLQIQQRAPRYAGPALCWTRTFQRNVICSTGAQSWDTDLLSILSCKVLTALVPHCSSE